MTHRLAWIATSGELIPDELEIDHMCGQTDCCNPAHLRLIDRGANISYAHFIKQWQQGLLRTAPTRRRRRPASIRTRTNKAGAVRYNVLYRDQSTGQIVQRSRTFDSEDQAKQFIKTPGHRADNPCRGVRLPRRNPDADEMVCLTAQEWATLDAALGTVMAGHYQLMMRTLVGTGMRWGEVAALRVSDLTVRPDDASVRIARAVKRDEHNRRYIGVTKTRRSMRTISLPLVLAGQLAKHTAAKTPADLVFTAPEGGMVHSSNVRERAGYRPSPPLGSPAGHASMTCGTLMRRADRRRRRPTHRAAPAQPRIDYDDSGSICTRPRRSAARGSRRNRAIL